MKYRIRLFLAVTAWPIIAVLAFNSGHTLGLKDMQARFDKDHGAVILEVERVTQLLQELPVSAMKQRSDIPAKKPG